MLSPGADGETMACSCAHLLETFGWRFVRDGQCTGCAASRDAIAWWLSVAVYGLRVMIIRSADPHSDAAACATIYRPYVSDSVTSFETCPPTVEEMSSRISAAYTWVIAEGEGVALGYAYASPHRERAAYRWAADVAVYIDADHHRLGVGRALYTRLFQRLRTIGLWTLCAGITQPNDASNGLHLAMGFVPVGAYRRIGWKAGAWHDVQWWQLDLRPGDPGPPGELKIRAA